MKIFKLPDLGEGLPDAIIREWYVKVGDEVNADQPMVAVETAKALVDVPAPFHGKITQLFGQAGDTIETGQPLIGFEGESAEEPTRKDSGTVVGSIETSDQILKESAIGLEERKESHSRIKATPALRMLAKQLGVDLATIQPEGEVITSADITKAIKMTATINSLTIQLNGKVETLSPVRRAMVLSMTHSHQHIAPVTLMDDADVYRWAPKQDVTLRLVRAIQAGLEAVPILNAYFDGQKLVYQLNESINLGIAVDTPHGLYVPVLKNIRNQTDAELRTLINRFKEQAQNKSLPAEDLHGATFMLSNFGAIAGRYASPMIVPPMVAILGVGRSYDAIVPENGKPSIHRLIPLSITVDHRLVTGGEAARFLGTLMAHLSKKE